MASMRNLRKSLASEIERNYYDYEDATSYLNDAIHYSDLAIKEDTEDYDDRIKDFLTCAADVFYNNGDKDISKKIIYYIRFF